MARGPGPERGRMPAEPVRTPVATAVQRERVDSRGLEHWASMVWIVSSLKRTFCLATI